VAIAVYKGANFVRVHSVRQIRMITQFADAVKRSG
jgi:dihydropteroate synthase